MYYIHTQTTFLIKFLDISSALLHSTQPQKFSRIGSKSFTVRDAKIIWTMMVCKVLQKIIMKGNINKRNNRDNCWSLAIDRSSNCFAFARNSHKSWLKVYLDATIIRTKDLKFRYLLWWRCLAWSILLSWTVTHSNTSTLLQLK